ncbi:MAG TPA: hypothetical protein ENF81_04060 [Thermotogaceae bacterium]|nr:hypothetical protein [Thermotogaceae bacterium]
MPRKNIYVKEKDMKLFKEAEAFGPISSVVVRALKQYVKEQKLRRQGFRNHVIIAEDLRYYFVGREIKNLRKPNKEIIVYQTKGNNFVVQRKVNGKSEVNVYCTISELIRALSSELDVKEVKRALKDKKIVWIN